MSIREFEHKHEKEIEHKHDRLGGDKSIVGDGGLSPEQQAITVGGTIVATTTIDAIMTSLFPTRTAELSGTPVYTWISNGPPVLSATWPTSTTDQGKCVQLLARFEVHSVFPSTAGP